MTNGEVRLFLGLLEDHVQITIAGTSPKVLYGVGPRWLEFDEISVTEAPPVVLIVG